MRQILVSGSKSGNRIRKTLVKSVIYRALVWNGQPGEVASVQSQKEKKKKKKIPTFGKPLLERTLKNVLKIVEPDQKPEGGRYGE